MLPFLTQPVTATACYVPREPDNASVVMRGGALTRVPAGAGNRRIMTVSLWGMLSRNDIQQTLISQCDGNSPSYNRTMLTVSGGAPSIHHNPAGSGATVSVSTVARIRDQAPMHLLYAIDTTHATPAERVRIHQAGRRLADLAAATYPAQNLDLWINQAGKTHQIGVEATSNFADGLLSDAIFVDGLALGPEIFGEYNIHGVWVPRPLADIHAAITAAGGWGTNGCHLDFSDPLQPGLDVSGQGNHWTATGFDSTGKDTVASTPTNVYAVLSPLNKTATGTIGGGCLAFTVGADSGAAGSIPLTGGKWYFETTMGTQQFGSYRTLVHGIKSATKSLPGNGVGYTGVGSYSFLVNSGDTSSARINGVITNGYGLNTANTGTVLMCAVDLDNGAIFFGQDGVWYNGSDPATGVAPAGAVNADHGPFVPIHGNGASAHGRNFAVDYGQRGFAYAPPQGFAAICTANLPEPAVKDPADGLAAVTATGADILALLDAATAHWSGADWIEIIKRRDVAEDWQLRFADDPGQSWACNNAYAKAAAAPLAAGGSYVGYRLRVGDKYGIWTAEVAHVTGGDTTVTHGLGAARNAVIATRVSAGGGERYIRHPDMPAGHLARINNAAASAADGTLTAFGPSSFVIAAAAPSGTYRVVVIAEVAGWCSLSAGKGTGTSDGLFAAGSGRPVLAISKDISTDSPSGTSHWMVWDVVRNPTNPCDRWLNLWSANGEYQGSDMSADLVVGGLKARGTNPAVNKSGDTFVVIQWGRPVGGVCVAPANAR